MINQERLARTFTTLCEIDSPSRGEGKLAHYLIQLLPQLTECLIAKDDSAVHTGSDTSNILFRLAGTEPPKRRPIFFNCHLDVVDPCIGVKVQRRQDYFTSSGDTVLGGDDKAGIAIILETITVLREQKLTHRPLELLFTTCEEIGLLGAKHLDRNLLESAYGYALDATGIDNLIIGAPAAVEIKAEIRGRAAHAGLHPDEGINAIQLAAQAISKLSLGQVDPESTANIGSIRGGGATNIIPDHVVVAGEIRSHSQDRLHALTDEFEAIFKKAVNSWHDPRCTISGQPALSFQNTPQYPLMHLTSDDEVCRQAQKAANQLQRDLAMGRAGGGSDANILNSLGLPTAIIGIGMEQVHSCTEKISLRNMVRTTELIIALATC